MTRVLVTGGAGTLGRALVPALHSAGHAVRVLSRSAPPQDRGTGEWAQADLASGDGLTDAIQGVDVIVHAATGDGVDVHGTQLLLTAAREAGTAHVVYVSIVGIERVPLPYYAVKLAAEGVVESGGVPYTILRATQFPDLMEQWFLRRLVAGARVVAVPMGYRFQLIDVRDVSTRLVEIVRAGPCRRAADIGGPEVLTLREIAREWRRATGHRALVVDRPRQGAIGAAYRAGHATTPANRYGTITWRDWLDERYRSSCDGRDR